MILKKDKIILIINTALFQILNSVNLFWVQMLQLWIISVIWLLKLVSIAFQSLFFFLAHIVYLYLLISYFLFSYCTVCIPLTLFVFILYDIMYNALSIIKLKLTASVQTSYWYLDIFNKWMWGFGLKDLIKP